MILAAIARLQKVVTIWAIGSLALISFLVMYLAAGKKVEKPIVVTDLPNLTGYLHGSNYEQRRQTSDTKQQANYEDGYRRGVRDSYKSKKQAD